MKWNGFTSQDSGDLTYKHFEKFWDFRILPVLPSIQGHPAAVQTRPVVRAQVT